MSAFPGSAPARKEPHVARWQSPPEPYCRSGFRKGGVSRARSEPKANGVRGGRRRRPYSGPRGGRGRSDARASFHSRGSVCSSHRCVTYLSRSIRVKRQSPRHLFEVSVGSRGTDFPSALNESSTFRLTRSIRFECNAWRSGASGRVLATSRYADSGRVRPHALGSSDGLAPRSAAQDRPKVVGRLSRSAVCASKRRTPYHHMQEGEARA